MTTVNALTKKQLDAVQEKVGSPYFRAGCGRKLTEADVEMALSLRRYGFSWSQIGDYFDCHKATVLRAIRRVEQKKMKKRVRPLSPYLRK
jgi:hypothetical protein